MRHYRITVAVAVAVTALTLSACGSSDTDASDTTATTAVPATTAAVSDAATPGTIVDVAAANPDFSTLVAAVKAAGLVETLSGTGPFTVFAPTDEAFAALPAGLLDKLLLPANKETLTKILTYHVLSSKVMAADVKAGKVATVEGSELTIATDGGVKVDKATVTSTDVAASNGVVHVIDQVLVPADVDVSKL
jgi:uncharacterized surface protein with fasciclin (FAS1) repeats